MRKYIFLLFLLVFGLQLWGQETISKDKVTLTTGEVYIGEIVVKTSEMVMIKTETGAKFQFPLSQVKLIEKVSGNRLSNTQSLNSSNLLYSEDIFSGQLELAGGVSSTNNSFSTSPTAGVSLTFGNKKAFGKDVFLGAGMGYNITFFESGTNPLELIPVYLRIQNTFTKERTAPFLGVDAGYAFSVNSNFGGGSFFKLSVGIVRKINFKTSLIVGIYGGLNQISGGLTEIRENHSYTYVGSTTMTSYGARFSLQF